MSKREDIQAELEEIAKKNDGILRPADVVEFAENEDTALHAQFEWDDSKAGHHYRLWQARQVIRINVTILEETQQEVRLFVSMPTDRINGGGYRYTVDILSNEEQRRELLKEAHKNFLSWKRKYNELKELIPVFEKMEQVMNEADVMQLPELAKAA